MNLSINFVFSDLTLVFLGKISYYTLPPKRDNVEESDAVIISDARKEFNIDEIYKSESSYIGGLKSIEDFHHIEILPNAPLSIDEEMIEVGGFFSQEQAEQTTMLAGSIVFQEAERRGGRRRWVPSSEFSIVLQPCNGQVQTQQRGPG
jgi:hypothetical protein